MHYYCVYFYEYYIQKSCKNAVSILFLKKSPLYTLTGFDLTTHAPEDSFLKGSRRELRA
jgi:hypothetical protein